MIESTMTVPEVAPFRVVEFRERAEFEEYAKSAEGLRGDRWLHEQSLATLEDAVILRGTCGICLTEAIFTASTRGGESAAGGRVPNWREELLCDCKQRLSNRHRAVLHYLLAHELLQPWSRILGLGEMGALVPMLKPLSQQVTCWTGSIERLPTNAPKLAHAHHLVISIEQLNAGSISRGSLSALARQLIDGGRLIFTAPFDVTLDSDDSGAESGPIGWAILSSLKESGFLDAKANLYWSEEFGYLGPLNFIFEASK